MPVEALLLRVMAIAQARGVRCAVGGSLAMAVHGYVRATMDVDVNVFTVADGLVPLLADLVPGTDAAPLLQRARERGDCRVLVDGTYVDFFLPVIDFHQGVETRLFRTDFFGPEMDVLSAEDLVVFKVLFNRPKDLVDVAQLALARPSLDLAWVRQQVAEMLGEADGRIAFLDGLQKH